MSWLLKIADLRGVTLYHGTPLERAEMIVVDKLRANATYDRNIINDHMHAVYLTANFDLALRYGLSYSKEEVPVVFEVYLSGRHMRKLRTDPMDQYDSAWDIESEYGNKAEEALQELRYDVNDFLGGYWNLFPDNYDQYDGLPLYANVLAIIRQRLQGSFDPKNEANRLYQEFMKRFPPEASLYYEITPDGTIRLTRQYWEKAHQLQYAPTKDEGQVQHVPISAIKAAWVPAGVVPPHVQVMEYKDAQAELLPDEARAIFEDKKSVLEFLYERMTELSEAETPEEIQDVADNIEFWGNVLPPELEQAQKFVQGIIDNPNEDWSAEIEDWRSRYESKRDYINEEHGQTEYGPKFRMAKIAVENIRELNIELAN